ncbi:MAG: hypothetical protein U9N54_03905 [candidate division Zixibacteria bacterium]|nr:hypothetical protein [candidate division Zixibacteria bacterium]
MGLIILLIIINVVVFLAMKESPIWLRVIVGFCIFTPLALISGKKNKKDQKGGTKE